MYLFALTRSEHVRAPPFFKMEHAQQHVCMLCSPAPKNKMYDLTTTEKGSRWLIPRREISSRGTQMQTHPHSFEWPDSTSDWHIAQIVPSKRGKLDPTIPNFFTCKRFCGDHWKSPSH